MDETRVDKWLWAVRVFKTRALATAACRGGHVRVNGAPAKPAATVRVGDRVEARAHDRPRVLEVARVIDKRVGAPLAAECVVDHSPLPPPREQVPEVFVRDRGAGRGAGRQGRARERGPQKKQQGGRATPRGFLGGGGAAWFCWASRCRCGTWSPVRSWSPGPTSMQAMPSPPGPAHSPAPGTSMPAGSAASKW